MASSRRHLKLTAERTTIVGAPALIALASIPLPTVSTVSIVALYPATDLYPATNLYPSGG